MTEQIDHEKYQRHLKLDDQYDQLTQRLRSLFLRSHPSEDFDEYMQNIVHSVESGDMTEQQMADLWTKYIFDGENSDHIFIPMKCTVALLVQSKIAYQYGEEAQALNLLNKAYKKFDIADVAEEEQDTSNQMKVAKRIEINKKASAGNVKKHDDSKAKILELLNGVPAIHWKNKKSVFTQIQQSLESGYKTSQNNVTFTTSNIVNLLYKYTGNDPKHSDLEIKKAYEDNSAKYKAQSKK